jgi:hypothetical protein
VRWATTTVFGSAILLRTPGRSGTRATSWLRSAEMYDAVQRDCDRRGARGRGRRHRLLPQPCLDLYDGGACRKLRLAALDAGLHLSRSARGASMLRQLRSREREVGS